MLIAHGGRVDLADWLWVTPLQLCAIYGRENQVQLLLDSGADKDHQDICGETALHAAAASKEDKTYAIPLKSGANPLQLNDRGLTSLDLARDCKAIMNLPELARFKERYKLLDQVARDAQTENSIRKILRIPTEFHSNGSRSTREMELALLLAERLSTLGRFEDVRIALEHTVQRNAYNRPVHRIPCSICHQCRRNGACHVCRDCTTLTPFCHVCYEKREGGQFTDKCPAEHNFLELGGAAWEGLKRGTVNKEGLSFGEWVGQLREEFGVPLIRRVSHPAYLISRRL